MVDPSRTTENGTLGSDGLPNGDQPSASPVEMAPMNGLSIERLVSEHHAVLYRYAFRLTGRSADAEDLTQQTFLLAQGSLHQVRDPAAARGWLFTILRNAWQRSCRQRLRLPLEPAEVDVNNLPHEVPDHPLDGEALQQALNELPDGYKQVLLMFYFEDCSYKEIAEKLSLAPGTVMSRLSRAKDHLRKKLFAREFGAVENESSQQNESSQEIAQLGHVVRAALPGT